MDPSSSFSSRRSNRTHVQLARDAGLARSSLLHYESLGLLVPSGRSTAGYRLYDDAQRERLRAICAYRAAGLSLAAIKDLLKSQGNAAAHILESHLLGLKLHTAFLNSLGLANEEVQAIRLRASQANRLSE